MYELASLGGARQGATGRTAHPRAVANAAMSASRAPEGSGVAGERQPCRNTRCLAPGPGAHRVSVGASAVSTGVLNRCHLAPESRNNGN